jgi:hypothetical protein
MKRIEVRDETHARLLGRIEFFGETADQVITRLLDAVEDAPPSSAPGGGRQPRAAPGSILAETEYWPVILEIIAEAGGEAHANDVIDEVGRRLDGRLTEQDREPLNMGEVRWRNRTRFARSRMKERGFLASPRRGVWAITDAGRQFLRAERGR